MTPQGRLRSLALSETDQSLQTEICGAVGALRDALLEALKSAGLADERSPRSLASRLQVDPKLAWRVVHLTEQVPSLQTARYVPGPGSLRTLLKGLKSLGTTQEQTAVVQRSAVVFESVIERHLGSRRSMEALLAGAASDPNDALAIELRRAGFESNASGLGIRAESQDLIAAQYPGDDPAYIDIAAVRTTLGLERLRPCVPWRVARPYPADESAEQRRQVMIEPLDAESTDRTGLNLVPALCSSPLPELVPHELDDGIIEYELSPGPLGVTGRRDLVYADRWRYTEPIHPREGESPITRLISRIRVPCERARWVMFTPKSLYVASLPSVAVYTMVWRSDTDFREADRLPLELTTRSISLQTLEQDDARLGHLARWLFDRISHRATTWVMTLTELAYPPMVSATTLSWERRRA